MANEWTWIDGSACFDGSGENIPLVQTNVLTVGVMYFVKVTVLNRTFGKLAVQGFLNAHEYTEDGEHTFFDIAADTDISFNPKKEAGSFFDGCIDDIEVGAAPLYVIRDSNDTVVFTAADSTGMTGDRNFIQYQIDWSDFEEGCYYIEFLDSGLTYQSDCLAIKLAHPCSIQLTWNNDEDGLGFDYSGLSFTQSMRVEGKLWEWRHKAEDKEEFTFSNGRKKLLYARVYEEETLSIKEMPKYMGRAFAIALFHDNFYIDGVKYTFPDEEVTPTHRRSTSTPPVEVAVIKYDQNLLNSNCG